MLYVIYILTSYANNKGNNITGNWIVQYTMERQMDNLPVHIYQVATTDKGIAALKCCEYDVIIILHFYVCFNFYTTAFNSHIVQP